MRKMMLLGAKDGGQRPSPQGKLAKINAPPDCGPCRRGRGERTISVDKFRFALIPLVLFVALGTGCGGPLVSDPASVPQRYESRGVDPYNLENARPRRSPVGLGDDVPNLLLMDQNGVEVGTYELVSGGDAVLIFSPGHASPQARPIYDWVRRYRTMISQRGAEVVVLSPDPVETNARVAEDEQLRVAVLYDVSGWGARSFGLIPRPEGDSVARPWTVVAGRDGRVMKAQAGMMPVSEVITTLEARPTPRQDFRAIDLLR